MATLKNASIEYTGGGIYVYSAQLSDGTWFTTDFQSFDSYGCYDAPLDVVEADILPDGSINYDGHWKDPSFPLPQWIEILQSIRSIDLLSAYDIEQHLPANQFCRVGENELPYDAHSERLETICEFIEAFEDFLDEKGIVIPNDEKEQDPESASNIYGTDYGNLSDRIEKLLVRYGVLN